MPLINKISGTLEYEIAEAIATPHCFTTRLGGVSTGIFDSLNLACHRGDDAKNVEENYQILANALGFDLKNIVLTRQTHSDIIRVVTKADCGGLDHHTYPECDGLITNVPGLALVVFTADCTPILLHDPITGAVGAVHAGWRGTAADIAGKAVRAMADTFGCDPGNIRAAIGPNIDQCCFATDADVPKAMVKALGNDALQHILTAEGKYYIDLKAINAMLLWNAGVKHIEASTSCTMCQSDRFWSHRVTRGNRGSQGAIIVCKEG
ncbi:MAG: peptidoglycan editing factor PgeF [Ruminococcaceae bacterium]|nr:peptidoglycan editing factor PgeF [Oscillospiraceae bacterium]